MPIRRAVAPLVLAFLSFTTSAEAQDLPGLLSIRAADPDPATVAGALVELSAADGGPAIRSATMPADGAPVSIAVPAGPYRLRVTRQDVRELDHAVMVAPHEVVRVSVHLVPAGADGESAATVTDRFPVDYRTAFDRQRLDALPHSRTVWSLLETAHPFLVADRIDGGGLYPGEPASLGGQGSSATQTTFRLDGVEVTDPLWIGTPVFYPDLTALGSVVVQSASIDAAAAGPGPTIEMVLPEPGAIWSGNAQMSGAPEEMQSKAGGIPPIARMQSWIDGGASAGGAIGNRARLFAAGRVTSGRRVEREVPLTLEGRSQSVAARLVATPSSHSTFSVLGGLAQATRPFSARARFADRDLEEDTGNLVLHATWARAGLGLPWSIGAGYQRAVRDADIGGDAVGGVMERLKDGPPLSLTTGEWNDSARWILTARAYPASRRWLGADHVLDLGGSIGHSRARVVGGLAQPLFGELVNGTPARVWQVAFRGPESRWGALTGAAFASDHVIVNDALSVAAALRLDTDHARADGGADDITWFDMSPRITARWRPLQDRALSIVTGYGWYRHRLPLGYLAVGDPNGPAGVVYRWDDRNGDRDWTATELTAVAGVGPAFALAEPNRIDSDLQRPTTREFRVGGEDVIAGWRLAVTGLDRREDALVVLANTGVTVDDYSVTFIDDPGVDIAGLSGSAPLPIYNRRTDSYLRDRFLLTNSAAQPSRFQSVDVVIERDAGEHWFLRFGGTAYRSEGVGASRGYRSDENDQGLLGEAFVSPNATTYARGRLFYDRGYMMKVLGAYAAPRVVSGSFVARYQDGQPFSRLIVVNGLNQGTDIVQTYPRGGQRFTYTLTLDARLVAEWLLAGQRSVGFTVEAFNLLNMGNEVEEDVVTGPAFRTVTAVQPPRVVRLGVRFRF